MSIPGRTYVLSSASAKVTWPMTDNTSTGRVEDATTIKTITTFDTETLVKWRSRSGAGNGGMVMISGGIARRRVIACSISMACVCGGGCNEVL